MHAKPDLRVFLKWMIAGSGSVIEDVIRLEFMTTSDPNTYTRDECKSLGFFYDRDDDARLWMLQGSKSGLKRFASSLDPLLAQNV